jgi:hypothetical protein
MAHMMSVDICDSIVDERERRRCREKAVRTLWNLLIAFGRA